MYEKLLWYILPQKKCNFNFHIFYGDPGPGSVTLGHVHEGNGVFCILLPGGFVVMLRNPRFSDIHSSQKERHISILLEITAMTCTHMSSDCARMVRNFGMAFSTICYQEQCTNEIWPKVH